MPVTPTGQTIIPWSGGVPYGEQAANINKFMANQALQQYNSNLPGYANAVGQRMENAQSMLQGELPQDVINQISQQSAERGISGGQAGGPNSNAAYLHALGLNSLNLMASGSSELSRSIADTPTSELFNPSSLWVPSVLGQQENEAAYQGLKSAGTGGTTARSVAQPVGSMWGMGGESAWTERFGRPSYSFL